MKPGYFSKAGRIVFKNQRLRPELTGLLMKITTFCYKKGIQHSIEENRPFLRYPDGI
jgi:hypothetical protein